MKAAVGAKPMAVPGLGAFVLYSICVAFPVLFQMMVRRYKLFPSVLMLCLGMQVCALVGVPLYILAVRCLSTLAPEEAPRQEPLKAGWLPSLKVVAGYVATGALVWLASHALEEIQIWQASALISAFSFALLACRLMVARNAVGVSAGKLLLDAASLSCRLAAMTLLGPRMPRKSCDPVVLVADGCSLALVLAALYGTLVHHGATYQRSADDFPSGRLLAFLAPAALLLRADLGHSLAPDTLWTLGLLADAVAPLPQLWLVAQNGGVADEATSHHLAAVFGSRLLAATFWWLIRGTWWAGTSSTGWGILVVHAAQLLSLTHYMRYYFKACFSRSLFSGVPLVCAEG